MTTTASKFRLSAAALAVLLFASPLPAQPLLAGHDAEISALRNLAESDARVARVAYRVAVRGAAFCPLKSNLLGLSVHTLDQYHPRLRPAATAAFGLGPLPAVLASAGDGPALAVRPGDWIAAVDGVAVDRSSAGSGPSHSRTAGLERTLEAAAADGKVELLLERAGKPRREILRTVSGCRSRVQLVPGKHVRAAANGTYVTISAGLLAFVQSDDELAFALAHEISHNASGHRPRIDRAGGGTRKVKTIRQTEIEADRNAFLMLRAAGYDVRQLVPFMERLFDGPASERPARGHLGRSERLRRARISLEEIMVNTDRQGN